MRKNGILAKMIMQYTKLSEAERHADLIQLMNMVENYLHYLPASKYHKEDEICLIKDLVAGFETSSKDFCDGVAVGLAIVGYMETVDGIGNHISQLIEKKEPVKGHINLAEWILKHLLAYDEEDENESEFPEIIDEVEK